MEPNSDQPPFWLSSPPLHRRRSSSPPFLSLPVLIVLLPTLALILLFFAIRSLLTLTPHLFRPNSVKKGWDSLNVFLVLFAIICGVFARRNDDVPTAAAVGNGRGSDRRTVGAAGGKVSGESEFPRPWDGFSDKRFSEPAGRTAAVVTTRLRRNSSYPDLRQESPWETGNDGNQLRFFDDFEMNKFRSRSFAYRARGSEIEESPAEIKVIPIDTGAASSSPVTQRLKSPNPPPSPPPLPVIQRKSRRTYQTIQKKEEVQDADEIAKLQSPPPPPPPPLPSRTIIRPSPVRVRLEEKFGKNGRKMTSVKKEIAMALASLYRKRKKKQKARNIYDGDHRHSPTEQRPPPPPPPPPPSVFRGLFKKSNKNKKVHSESVPPPPPPPLPPVLLSTKKKIQIPPTPSPPPPSTSRQRNATANRRPPLPARMHNSYIQNEGTNNTVQSQTIPPPPTPPPFKTPTDMKSRVQTDTFGSLSSETSRCGSPVPENVEPSSSVTTEPAVEATGGGFGPVFCPSPDVNIKAANFIARLRCEWRLEKMNSVREKERLGQGPNYETVSGPGPNV